MRVLFVANYYPIPATPARGVFIRRQAQALVRAGVSVAVVHPLPKVIPGAELFTKRALHFKDLLASYDDGAVHVIQPRYFTYPGHLRLGIPEVFQYRAVRRLRLDRPDIVHGQFAAPAGLTAMRLSREWRVPFVLSLRGYDTNFWPHMNRYNRERFKSVCAAADRLLANSRDLAEKARALSGVEAEVLSSGIEIDTFRDMPGRDDARRLLDLPADRFIALYVGNHIRAKGMEELAQAAGGQSDVLFVTIGDGPWRSRLASMPNTLCIPQCPSDEIVTYMAAADVLVHPSHSEGMPNVVLEAGAAGLPVVAARVGGVPELIGDGARGLLVPTRDANALESAIGEIRRHPGAASVRAALLRDHVREHYDANHMARRLAGIYEQLVRSSA